MTVNFHCSLVRKSLDSIRSTYLDTSESRSKIPSKFLNVMLEKDQLDWSWKNEEVLQRVNRNLLHMITQRKANWINHILCRDCLQKHVIEGKIEGTVEQERSYKQLLNGLKEMRRYWKLRTKH